MDLEELVQSLVMASFSFLFAVAATLLLLLVVGGSTASAEVAVPVAADVPLYALWSGLTSTFFNISTIDSSTGAQGPQLYTSAEWVMLFPITPAVDHQGKRLFAPLLSMAKQEMALGVFDVSKVSTGQVTLETTIKIGETYVMGLHYDPAGDQVWVIGTDMHKRASGVWVELVDLSAGTSKRVATVPYGAVPAASGIGGAPTAFDQKNRLLVFPARTEGTSPHFYWTRLDVQKLEWSNVTLDTLYPAAMAWDSESGLSYGLFSPASGNGGPLAFGTIDSLTGKVHVINQWDSTKFVFIVGSLAAYSPTKSQFYSVSGTGESPPVALLSASTVSGQLEHATYFSGREVQPSGLFCL